MAPLGLGVGALGVGGLPQVADDLSQPGWVQPSGRLQEHRLGLGGDRGEQVTGAMSQRRGVGDRELPGAQRLGGARQGAAEQRPSGPHRAGRRGGAHPEAVAQPAGGRGRLDALLGPGAPAGVEVGELVEPVALQAVGQPPQGQDPLGPDPDWQAGQVLGGQAVDVGGEGL
jgi:hypothetical protein